MRHESLKQMDARSHRYHRAWAAYEFAIKANRRPPQWSIDEMWATCLGPARPVTRGTPEPGKAEHERTEQRGTTMKIETVEQLKAAVEEWHASIHGERPPGFQIAHAMEAWAVKNGYPIESMDDWKTLLREFLLGAEIVSRAIEAQFRDSLKVINEASDNAKAILSRCV